MEENKDDDIIYDLDSPASAATPDTPATPAGCAEEESLQRDSDGGTVMESGHSDRCAVGAVASTVCGITDYFEQIPEPAAALAPEGALQGAPSGAAVRMTALHEPPATSVSLEPDTTSSPHEDELRRMVEEMGAETLLEIIRGNRNAAIRQIISEVEASRDQPLPSGGSGSLSCCSIFDLAALA